MWLYLFEPTNYGEAFTHGTTNWQSFKQQARDEIQGTDILAVKENSHQTFDVTTGLQQVANKTR